MLRPLGLASLSLSLAACASILGDFDVAAGTPDAATSSSGGLDGGPTGEGGPGPDGGGALDAGPQPEPVAVAVHQFATCATVKYGTALRSYCWGAGREFVGAGPTDQPTNGFFVPRVVGGGALVLDKIIGTGTGGWFLGSGNDVQGTKEAFSWGSNRFGQSGQGLDPATENVLPNRLKLAGASARTFQPKTGAGGLRHGCLIEDDKLYCWGQDDNCQVGSGAVALCVPNSQPQLSPKLTTPISALPGKPILYERVAAGVGHTCVIARENASAQATVYCFGQNSAQQCGASTLGAIGAAQAVKGVDTALPAQMEIAAGEQHTCAIVGRKLYCWGANNANQALPNGDNTKAAPPKELDIGGLITGNLNLSLLTLAGDASCVVAGNASVKSRAFCFGRGELGRDGSATGVAPVAGIEDITALALSNKHGCAIAKPLNGTEVGLYCWGSNTAKAVDPNSSADRMPTPVRVLFPTQ